MSGDLPTSCKCFGLYESEGNIVGFIGVLHQPHGQNKKIKRVSRLVILPDYQGVGLGYLLLNIVAKYYTDQGFDFSINTSAKNFIAKLANSPDWIMTGYEASACTSCKSAIDYKRKSQRTKCRTGRFMKKK